jgi:hypothetical protein
MKKRKNSRRNLLVRFIRWVYKSLDTLFKRKKSTFRSLDRQRISTQERDMLPRSAPLADRANDRDISPRSAPLDDRANEQLITVGELFDRVQWQFPEENVLPSGLRLNRSSQPLDVSRN